MTEIRVLLFGPAKQACNGASEVKICFAEHRESVSAAEVVSALKEQHCSLRNLVFILAVNQEYVDLNALSEKRVYPAADEIVVIPPISGG